MGTLTYDFESDATGFPPAGWSTGEGSGTANISDSSGDNIWTITPSSGSHSYRNTDVSAAHTNIIVSGEFKLQAANPTTAFCFIRHNGTFTTPARQAYWFSATSIVFSLWKGVAGSASAQLATAAKTHTVGSKYNFKIEASGTTIRAKTWPSGDAEPASWDHSVTDSAIASGATLAIGANTNSVIFDDIVVQSADINDVQRTWAGSGAIGIEGYNPSVLVSCIVDVTPLGTLEVEGYNPVVVFNHKSNVTATLGTIEITGYNPTVSAEQPQTAALWFKFKDTDGVIKSYNIGRRPSIQTIVAPVGDPPESSTDVNDDIVLVDATNNSIAINMPQAAGREGFMYWIKKIDASANTVTVTPDGADTIDGAATKVLSSQYEVVCLVSDGSDWWIIG